ncbi:hypothetical protein CYMTET_2563 [Cymbomonas tetramitiformis]|uniref:Tail fiber domain-containing protein n=1 Tax=Cymbomonas tetramitiformis TaxID=36881 RepID=A0AAE0H503_9CHLO|nr:hypothetical protein CYMTET_2563 [Cymbomonas tetramitiformis]
MARMYLANLYAFVGTAVVSAAGEKQEFVEQDFRMRDVFDDPYYSSTIAAHEGFRVFTNITGQGLTESLTLTHKDGLYVAGETVVAINEVLALAERVKNLEDKVDRLESADVATIVPTPVSNESSM